MPMGRRRRKSIELAASSKMSSRPSVRKIARANKQDACMEAEPSDLFAQAFDVLEGLCRVGWCGGH